MSRNSVINTIVTAPLTRFWGTTGVMIKAKIVLAIVSYLILSYFRNKELELDHFLLQE